MLTPKGVQVVALGNFDGVHLGHRVVIRRAVEEARARSMRCVAATFDPHPQAILRPGSEPKLLTPLDVKKEMLIKGLGVDEVRVIPFDSTLARKSPRCFVLEVLVGKLGCRIVVVGENFRFGYKASGRFGDLIRYMREAGGEAIAVPIYSFLGESISSTKIRALVTKGEVREAARLLGRPYSLRGRVVAGEGRGKRIGFPTANVVPLDARALVPGRGVYAGRVRVLEGGISYGACTNVGLAPTFAGATRREGPLVEAHLIDYEGEALYGKVVDVTFVERLRAEKRFKGIEDLKEQIARDVAQARRIVERDA